MHPAAVGRVRREEVEAGLDAALADERPGRGRPRKRPDRPIADKGYSCPACRRLPRRRGIPHTISVRRDQRRLPFDPAVYRRRNVVERCVNRLEQWRAVAAR